MPLLTSEHQTYVDNFDNYDSFIKVMKTDLTILENDIPIADGSINEKRRRRKLR